MLCACQIVPTVVQLLELLFILGKSCGLNAGSKTFRCWHQTEFKYKGEFIYIESILNVSKICFNVSNKNIQWGSNNSPLSFSETENTV